MTAKEAAMQYAVQIVTAFCGAGTASTIQHAKLGDTLGDTVVRVAEKIAKYLGE